MRDYRAWDKKTKQMCKVLVIDFRNEKVQISIPSGKNGYKCFVAQYRKFDEIILMQYTGLTDKNGTKIFEGDIIKHGYFNRYCREKLTAKYIVKWGKCGFGISLACVTEQDICEVIGNIHEQEVAE